MLRLARSTLLFLLVVFILPALATLAWWVAKERPATWRNADWTSAHVLPLADADEEAAIYIMAARTGGLKGAFAVHSWIVLKKVGGDLYDRYDKVGWGAPVRRNSRPADGRWYSNEPFIVRELHGEAAGRLIPKIEAAIESYPYSRNGDYRIWPGPNSNSFVAHVLREVPQIGAALPSNAIGRDFWPGVISAGWSPDAGDFHFTIYGLAGFVVGLTSGFEVHFAGLVAGFDPFRPALKVPAYGRVNLWDW